MYVIEISLLGQEDFKKWKSFISPAITKWWLQSPGCDTGIGTVVHPNNGLSDMCRVSFEKIGVRPCIKTFGLRSKPGDAISLYSHSWTCIAEDLLLCDEVIFEHRFDPSSNVWDKSELKTFLEKWFELQKLEAQRVASIYI